MAITTMHTQNRDDTLIDSRANDDKGPTFLVITCVLTACSLVSTILRFLARRYRRSLGWDDYLIAATAALIITRSGWQIASVKHGNGKHRSQVSDSDYVWVVMQGWVTQLILFPTLCLLKCSICFLLLRIKGTPRTTLALRVIMVGLVITNLEPVIILLAECSPVKTYWDPQAGTCWNPKVRIYSIYFQVAYSVLTDLICSLMPVFVVYKIQMPMRDKVMLCGLMSLGLVATASATVRAVSLGVSTSDLTYDYCIAAIWANVELHLGIIAANAACGRHIYTLIRHGFHYAAPPKPSQINGSTNGSHFSGPSSSRNRGGYLRSMDDNDDYGHDGTDYHAALDGGRSARNRTSGGRMGAAGTLPTLSLSRSRGGESESEIPLQDGIQKITEYVVETSPMSPENPCPPGNGKWFIDGKL